jgi:hypothetical protein
VLEDFGPFVWISPGLWFCGRSEIESRSSRFQCLSPHRLVTSNLGRYKASYLRCFSSSNLVRTYCHEDRAAHGFVPISNDILTYSIFDEEYECYHSLVLEALRENHLYVELKKGAF